ncbi:MAG: efflux RND transporter periplasmic adaptor subunit [Bacteroidetes bacterium]|nr:efflux RND transporter periplasmic adaptor subunit [Bacteroidota bacterium]
MFHKRIAVALSIGLSVAALGCYDKKEGPPQNALFTPSVEVVQARLGRLPLKERLTGVVRARNQVDIYSEISAPVVRVVAQNGDRVAAGAPLVYLRDKQYTDQLKQMEAALQIAQADAKRTAANKTELQNRLSRVEQLADKQFQSDQELDQIKAQFASASAAHEQAIARIAQAEANVEEQREMVRRTVVRAPVAGYVGLRNVEVGMRVDPGTPLFTLGDFSRVKVDIAIPDRMVGDIKVGNTVLLSAKQFGDSTVVAAVSRISPFLEQGSYSAAAEIDVPNSGGLLRAGMFVEVDVLYGESDMATLIPESALYENPNSGQIGVYIAPSLRSETPIESPDEYSPDSPENLTDATPVEFRPVDVLARGSGVAGVSVVRPDDWVVTVGQNLVRFVDGKASVRARPMAWERIAELQSMHDQDLLKQFMEKQQRLAREDFSSDGTVVDSNTESEQAATTPSNGSGPSASSSTD